MYKLKQHTATVLCRRDGRVKRFYYLAARRPDGSVHFGLRYGCGDKAPGCAECIQCWNGLRHTVTAANPPAPLT